MTGPIVRRIVRSAAFCLLLLLVPALMVIPSGAAENTYLLVGTVESKDFTGAVIITPDGKQSFYRLREKLPDGAELVQVHARSISLKGSDGSRYDMFITATAMGAKSAVTAMPSPNVTPSEPRESMANSAKKFRRKAGRVVGPDNDE